MIKALKELVDEVKDDDMVLNPVDTQLVDLVHRLSSSSLSLQSQPLTSPSPSSPTSPEEAYTQALLPLMFQGMDLTSSNGDYDSHLYASAIQEDMLGKDSRTRARRVNRELKSLKTSLPLHFGSSVCLRVDLTRAFVCRVLIMAPSRTPYDSGCFLIDVYYPPDYPAAPPKMSLVTTGKGTVRFNPNLYDNGKICLSLLGTWRGGASGNENWNPKSSSLWQVLVSIQSAIFGSEFPYFNEPGAEAQFGSAEGELQKRVHRNGGYERLRIATIDFAMVDMMKHPPKGFEEIIKVHFQLKREYILGVVNGWLEEAKLSDTKGHFEALKQRLESLKEAFELVKDVKKQE